MTHPNGYKWGLGGLPPRKGGEYYCGCAYVGKDRCPEHGDPVERWPRETKDETSKISGQEES